MYMISVIVPVYNAENYLEKTINSVINQTFGFEKIELILVDDNSMDNSKKIIEQYSDKYENIVPFYSKKNHGFPGFGRNMGLKLASADYIMFLDNDDEYDEDICKKLYDSLINEKADLVSCGRVVIDFSEVKDDYNCSRGGQILNNFQIFENDEVLSFCSITVWNKIFKKDIIDKFELKFLEDSSADDFVFSVEYHSKSKKIVHLRDYYGYRWNIRNESLSHDIKIEHIKEVLVAYKYLVSKLKNENQLLFANVVLKRMVLLLVSKCSYLHVTLSEFKRMLKDIYDFEKDIDFNDELTDKWFDIANKFILRRFFYLSIFYLKFLDFLRKSTFLRKINRLKQ